MLAFFMMTEPMKYDQLNCLRSMKRSARPKPSAGFKANSSVARLLTIPDGSR